MSDYVVVLHGVGCLCGPDRWWPPSSGPAPAPAPPIFGPFAHGPRDYQRMAEAARLCPHGWLLQTLTAGDEFDRFVDAHLGRVDGV